jgi:hypothetical protein
MTSSERPDEQDLETPEADAIEQQQDVVEPEDAEDLATAGGPVELPDTADPADVLDQLRVVEEDDDRRDG